jgi:hypothetical protein
VTDEPKAVQEEFMLSKMKDDMLDKSWQNTIQNSLRWNRQITATVIRKASIWKYYCPPNQRFNSTVTTIHAHVF